jgi:hypothetical protein
MLHNNRFSIKPEKVAQVSPNSKKTKTMLPAVISKTQNNKAKFSDGNYVGELLNGKRHGKGKHTYISFTIGKSVKYEVIYDGHWENDKRNGMGKLICSCSNTYEGMWVNNNLDKKCKIVFRDGNIYEGDIDENYQPNGTGELLYKNKDRYSGFFKDGKPDGTGKKIFTNGNIYEGNFSNGHITGTGKMTHNNGEIYEGQFYKGKMHGTGKLINENIYEGNFKNDFKCGKGKLILECGDIYEGNFEDDEYHGFGKMEYINGNIEDGIWNDGIYFGSGYVFNNKLKVKIMHMEQFDAPINIALLNKGGCQYLCSLRYKKIIDTIKLPFIAQSFNEFIKLINGSSIHITEKENNTDQYCCPISMDTMIDPVITSCGHTFCKSTIIKCKDTCPLCREKILYFLPNDEIINVYKKATFYMNNLKFTYDDIKIIAYVRNLYNMIERESTNNVSDYDNEESTTYDSDDSSDDSDLWEM